MSDWSFSEWMALGLLVYLAVSIADLLPIFVSWILSKFRKGDNNK